MAEPKKIDREPADRLYELKSYQPSQSPDGQKSDGIG